MIESPPKPQEPEQGLEPAPPNSNADGDKSQWRYLRLLLPLGLLVVGGGFAGWYFFSRPKSEALELSGRIEGYPTDIDAKVAGRVESVAVREGDRVQKGAVIVRLDDDEIQARLEGATARLAAARQAERQAQFQIAVIESQIQEAQLNLQQSTRDAEGRIFQAEANVAAVEAQLSQAVAQFNEAKAELALARTDRDRFAQLVREGAVPQQRFDQAQTAFETAQATAQSREATVAAARRQVNAAQGALTQARSTGLNPGIRSAQIDTLRQQLQVGQSQLAAAQAEVSNAQAARQEILAEMAYLNLVSPIDGVVITRTVEPGTVVATGTTLLTVLDPNRVYLRGFIPEGDIGKVRVGQPARVYLDSAPNRPFSAYVGAIDTEASFTPENIYFKEDRVKQVFGVDLRIKDPEGFAKPGMPADAEIVTAEAPDS